MTAEIPRNKKQSSTTDTTNNLFLRMSNQTLSAYCVDIVDKLNAERLRLMNEIEGYNRIRLYAESVVFSVGFDDDITIDEKLDELNQAKRDVVWQQKFYTYAHNKDSENMKKYHEKMCEYELEHLEEAQDGKIFNLREMDLDFCEGEGEVSTKQGALIRMGKLFKERYDQRKVVIEIVNHLLNGETGYRIQIVNTNEVVA